MPLAGKKRGKKPKAKRKRMPLQINARHSVKIGKKVISRSIFTWRKADLKKATKKTINKFLTGKEYFRPDSKNQSRVTPAIERFAKTHGAKKRMGIGETLECIINLAKSITHFSHVDFPHEVGKKFYAKRTAEQILKSKKIIGISEFGEKLGISRAVTVEGCVDHSLLMHTLIKAVSKISGNTIESNVKRRGIHSTTRFEINGIEFEIDHASNYSIIQKMDETNLRIEKRMMNKGFIGLGDSPHNIGLMGLKDYFKFSKEYQEMNQK